jgi:serine/threonine protein kinase
MSPEQASGEPLGAETDLWALAVVVFEGLTGKNPVRGRTAAETARNLTSGEIPLLADERPDLPEELVDAVDGALEPDPDDRGTLGELGGALLAAISQTMNRAPFRRR